MRRVHVVTHARLHLGFLDLNGGLNRRFGSIGLAIDAFPTDLTLWEASETGVFGPERERAAGLLHRLDKSLGARPNLRLDIRAAIPPHSGLGSGTQLALAIGAARRAIAGLAQNTAVDALLLERGARSGVGVALFERGGLVVDAGRGGATTLPPIVSTLAFPHNWRVVLVLDRRAIGVHGSSEAVAFSTLPRLAESDAAEICRETLMRVLPGAAEADLSAFGDGVTRIQEILGDHFAPAQGGGRFISPAVARVVAHLATLGAKGCGQSSWGPTGFAFVADVDEAERLAALAREEAEPGIEILVCRAREKGADISVIEGD